ncbi:Lrp/AsnC family transcriptional regulator [Spongiibacter sp. KMU-166]|uniref:Lrp/AsnC family transcriptional regulator n=1 Tax=Spongiibacter thalassae TaxID=2721624 RepID=A0ABX1GBG5_9GAMM|nr:Lrp/AsnC family transcriptional regulator [Spongiibacter thalassae]NKI15828.1 Lrp/AsnC family transcriptional regulator [Spongiibacter thalassae]
MKELDDIDRNLTKLLRANPSITNRTLTEKLGISEKNVLSRLSALCEDDRLKVTAQWDMHSLGLDIAGHVYIHPGSNSIQSVSEKIAEIDEVQSVAEVTGWPALHVLIVVTNIQEFYAIADSLPARIPGIRLIETEVACETVKYRSDYGSGIARDTWTPSIKKLNPRIKLDDFDLDIVSLLQKNARISNREIARQFNVSETMVRQRLKKLQQQSALRKVVVVNPFVFDYGAGAIVRARIGMGQASEYCLKVSTQEHFVAVMKVVGHYNVTMLVLGENLQTITDEVYDSFSGFSEVGEYTILPVIKTYKHRHRLVSLSRSSK